MKKLKVLGICGSLRVGSFNRMALKIAMEIAGKLGAEVKEADLKELALPMYDGDIEAAGMPESVLKLGKMVKSADVLLIASPEYNYSVTGVLKNTIDWLSRGERPLYGKIAVIFGVSGGPFGTVRGQNHLRQILTATGVNVTVLPQPQVLVRNGSEAFNSDGTFKDLKTTELLEELIKKTFDLF